MIDEIFQWVMLSLITVVLLFITLGGLFLLIFQTWEVGQRVMSGLKNREVERLNIERKELDLELYEQTARIRIERYRRDMLGKESE